MPLRILASLVFLFFVHRCSASYNIDFTHELRKNSGLKAIKCTVAMEELEKTKEIIDDCKNAILVELDDVLNTGNLTDLKNEEDLDREMFGKMIICVYKRLNIITGSDYGISMKTGIEVFQAGIGQKVHKFKDVEKYHDVVLPMCYGKSLEAAKEAYGDDFLTKPVDPDALPIFYYNLFSCQEKAIEKMCRMKEDLSIVGGGRGVNTFKPTFGPLTFEETCHVYFTLKIKADGTPEVNVPYGVILPEELLDEKFGEKCVSLLLEEAYTNEKGDPYIVEEGEDQGNSKEEDDDEIIDTGTTLSPNDMVGLETKSTSKFLPLITSKDYDLLIKTTTGPKRRTTIATTGKDNWGNFTAVTLFFDAFTVSTVKQPSTNEELGEHTAETVARKAVHHSENWELEEPTQRNTELLQSTGHVKTKATKKVLPRETRTVPQFSRDASVSSNLLTRTSISLEEPGEELRGSTAWNEERRQSETVGSSEKLAKEDIIERSTENLLPTKTSAPFKPSELLENSIEIMPTLSAEVRTGSEKAKNMLEETSTSSESELTTDTSWKIKLERTTETLKEPSSTRNEPKRSKQPRIEESRYFVTNEEMEERNTSILLPIKSSASSKLSESQESSNEMLKFTLSSEEERSVEPSSKKTTKEITEETNTYLMSSKRVPVPSYSLTGTSWTYSSSQESLQEGTTTLLDLMTKTSTVRAEPKRSTQPGTEEMMDRITMYLPSVSSSGSFKPSTAALAENRSERTAASSMKISSKGAPEPSTFFTETSSGYEILTDLQEESTTRLYLLTSVKEEASIAGNEEKTEIKQPETEASSENLKVVSSTKTHEEMPEETSSSFLSSKGGPVSSSFLTSWKNRIEYSTKESSQEGSTVQSDLLTNAEGSSANFVTTEEIVDRSTELLPSKSASVKSSTVALSENNGTFSKKEGIGSETTFASSKLLSSESGKEWSNFVTGKTGHEEGSSIVEEEITLSVMRVPSTTVLEPIIESSTEKSSVDTSSKLSSTDHISRLSKKTRTSDSLEASSTLFPSTGKQETGSPTSSREMSTGNLFHTSTTNSTFEKTEAQESVKTKMSSSNILPYGPELTTERKRYDGATKSFSKVETDRPVQSIAFNLAPTASSVVELMMESVTNKAVTGVESSSASHAEVRNAGSSKFGVESSPTARETIGTSSSLGRSRVPMESSARTMPAEERLKIIRTEPSTFDISLSEITSSIPVDYPSNSSNLTSMTPSQIDLEQSSLMQALLDATETVPKIEDSEPTEYSSSISSRDQRKTASAGTELEQTGSPLMSAIEENIGSSRESSERSESSSIGSFGSNGDELAMKQLSTRPSIVSESDERITGTKNLATNMPSSFQLSSTNGVLNVATKGSNVSITTKGVEDSSVPFESNTSGSSDEELAKFVSTEESTLEQRINTSTKSQATEAALESLSQSDSNRSLIEKQSSPSEEKSNEKRSSSVVQSSLTEEQPSSTILSRGPELTSESKTHDGATEKERPAQSVVFDLSSTASSVVSELMMESVMNKTSSSTSHAEVSNDGSSKFGTESSPIKVERSTFDLSLPEITTLPTFMDYSSNSPNLTNMTQGQIELEQSNLSTNTIFNETRASSLEYSQGISSPNWTIWPGQIDLGQSNLSSIKIFEETRALSSSPSRSETSQEKSSPNLTSLTPSQIVLEQSNLSTNTIFAETRVLSSSPSSLEYSQGISSPSWTIWPGQIDLEQSNLYTSTTLAETRTLSSSPSSSESLQEISSSNLTSTMPGQIDLEQSNLYTNTIFTETRALSSSPSSLESSQEISSHSKSFTKSDISFPDNVSKQLNGTETVPMGSFESIGDELVMKVLSTKSTERQITDTRSLVTNMPSSIELSSNNVILDVATEGSNTSDTSKSITTKSVEDSVASLTSSLPFESKTPGSSDEGLATFVSTENSSSEQRINTDSTKSQAIETTLESLSVSSEKGPASPDEKNVVSIGIPQLTYISFEKSNGLINLLNETIQPTVESSSIKPKTSSLIEKQPSSPSVEKSDEKRSSSIVQEQSLSDGRPSYYVKEWTTEMESRTSNQEIGSNVSSYPSSSVSASRTLKKSPIPESTKHLVASIGVSQSTFISFVETIQPTVKSIKESSTVESSSLIGKHSSLSDGQSSYYEKEWTEMESRSASNQEIGSNFSTHQSSSANASRLPKKSSIPESTTQTLRLKDDPCGHGLCPKLLTVDCGNFSELTNLDQTKMTKVLFLINNMDETTSKEVQSTKLDYTLEEYESFCQDSRFNNTPCEQLEDAFKNDFPIFLEALLEACMRRGLVVNCSNVDMYANEKIFDEVKAKHVRVLFVTENGSTMVKSEDVTVSDINDYRNGCRTDFCDIGRYMKSKLWESVWKKVLQKCLSTIDVNCKNVDYLLDSSMALDANMSVIEKWRSFCNNMLIVGCGNVSKHFHTKEDFEDFQKSYTKITFLFFNLDEHITWEETADMLTYDIVEQFKSTCNDSLLINSSCVDNFDAFKNRTNSNIFQLLILDACLRNVVYINCTTCKKYLQEDNLREAKKKYSRIGFLVRSGIEIGHSNDVDLLEIERYDKWCESNSSCVNVEHYRDSIFWEKIWKSEFEKCWEQILSVDCENIGFYFNEANLASIKAKYKTIEFLWERAMVVSSGELDGSLLEVWSSFCKENLTVSCYNFSSHLTREADLERSKKNYAKIALLLQNVDEQVKLTTDSAQVSAQLVAEFMSACQDEQFGGMRCVGLSETLRKKHETFSKLLLHECTEHSAYINCTNAGKYVGATDLNEAKTSYPRIAFAVNGEVVIVKSEEVTTFDMNEYYIGCKSEYLCRDVVKYMKSKLWQQLWTKVFQTCLKETLNYTCQNIDGLLEPSKLRYTKKYKQIFFYWDILEEPLVKETSLLTLSTVYNLMDWCGGRLTVSCGNFSKHLEDINETKKNAKILVLLLDNPEHLQLEMNTTNLNYSIIKEYKAACQDFFNTSCTDRYANLKNYSTFQNLFFDICSEKELHLNCSNIHPFFTKKALSDAQKNYERISFSIENADALIINAEAVTVADIKEYANGCRDDHFCKDIVTYKRKKDWESVWKDVFSKCMKSVLKINCSHLEKGRMEQIRGYQKIQFEERGETFVVAASEVDETVMKQWSDMCNWLVVGCNNITNHLDLEALKKHTKVTFLLRNVDEEVHIELSAKLNYSLVDEIKASCLDGQLGNTTCIDVFDTFKDDKKYKILPKVLHNACFRNGLYINCTTAEKYVTRKNLDQAKKIYPRFVFAMERENPMVVKSDEVTVFDTIEYSNGCKSEYFCSDKKKYMKSAIWERVWKKIFQKCLKGTLNYTCANIDLLKPSELQKVKEDYKLIGFQAHEKLLLTDASLVTISTINDWKVWCSDHLTISCANYSKYLRDFEEAKKTFKKVVFLVKNVDEAPRLSADLESNLVEEFQAVCNDQQFNTTTCIKRYEKLKKTKNYPMFLKLLFETCSQSEIFINCSNVHQFLTKEVVPNTFSSYKRILFEMEDYPSIVNATDVTRDLVLEYADGCSVERFCKDRNKYKQTKDWETVWKEVFRRCLKDVLTLTCKDVEKGLGVGKLREIHNGYKKIEFFYEQRGWRFLKDAAEVNGTVVNEWRDLCHKWLVVGCGNFSQYLETDFETTVKTYMMVIFLLENIDEYIEIEKRAVNLTHSFVKEFNLSCNDRKFSTTSCSRRFDEYTNGTDYETILKFFFSRCSRHEFYLNCSNSKKYITGIGIKSAKARYNRIVFRITNGNPVILPSREVNPAVITAYSDGCKDEYLCQEVERYKKRKDWDIFWKRVFEGCRENLTINCSDIEEFDNEIWVEAARSKYDYIEFQSLTFDAKDLNFSIVKNVKKICFPPLVIGCRNVSSYFNLDDFEATRKKYASVSFRVENIEENFQIEKQSVNLDQTFITEYNSSCQDPLFRQTPCVDRYEEFKSTTRYTTILKDFFALCSLHELYINCTNIDKHVKKNQIGEAKKHKRIVFQENSGKITVVSTKSKGVAEGISSFHDLCYDDEVLCSDRYLYKNKPNWASYWKEKFDVCLSDHVVLSCANVSEFVYAKKLQKLTNQYATIRFISLDNGKMMQLNTKRVNTSVVKVWNSTCDVKNLTVGCDNFTEYLLAMKGFKRTKTSYVTVTFLIRNVDEDVVIEKSSKVLKHSFVVEFKAACLDQSFKDTPCRRRNERLKNITYKNILTEFFNACARNELLIDCSNAAYFDDQAFREAKEKYKRISFLAMDGTSKVFPNQSPQLDVEMRAMNKCSDQIPCTERGKYKTKKNWATFWKKRFDRCLKQVLQISCLNINTYNNPINLETAKDEYASVNFTDGFNKEEIHDMLQVNLVLVQAWNKSCTGTLTVSCSNFTKYLYFAKDFYLTKKLFATILFIMENIDETYHMAKTGEQLNYKFVNEYRHSCKDPLFRNTHCKDRYLKLYKTKNYRQILNILFFTCSRRELFVNCSNAGQHLRYKQWNPIIKRIVFDSNDFTIKDFNSTSVRDDIREFSKKCDKRYPCSDRSMYKKDLEWGSYWKKRFDRCLEDHLLLTCKNVRKYLVLEELEGAKDLYRKIGFESRDAGKLVMLDTLFVTLTTVQKWSDSCSKTLMVSCGNFSNYDFERSRKEYVTVSFLVSSIEKFYYDKPTDHLPFSFINEYKLSCQDETFWKTPCRDRFQIKDKEYSSISAYFFEKCSRDEFRVNCSTVLDGVDKKFSRILADFGDGLKVLNNSGVEVMRIKEECDGRVSCSERARYKKNEMWLSYWKKKFDRCLKDEIVLTCLNTNVSQLEAFLDEYRTVKFLHEEGGKITRLDSSAVSSKFLKKWIRSCSKILTVACGNFTEHLYLKKDFEATKTRYSSVTFMIDNIDEAFSIEKITKSLSYKFVNEFRLSCQDESFKNTLCKDRSRLKTSNFKTITRLFSSRCSQNEFFINCTNVEVISGDVNLYKSRYHRVAFSMGSNTTIETFNVKTIVDAVKKFRQKCNSGIPCSKRNDYKMNKNWESYWKKHFDKCLQPSLSLFCSNLTKYSTQKALDAAKDQYRQVILLFDDPGRSIILDTLRITTKVIKEWKQSCILTISCSNFTRYLYLKNDYDNALTNYEKIMFIIDNVDESFIIEKKTSKLRYKFINDYRHSCNDRLFKITRCNDRFDLLANENYRRILQYFFRTCSINERYINCSNINNYMNQKVLQQTVANYKRIFTDYGGNHFEILNVNNPNITNVIKAFREKCTRRKYKKPRILSKKATFEARVKQMRESYETKKKPNRRLITYENDRVVSKLRGELKRYRGMLEKVNMTKDVPRLLLNSRTREAVLKSLKERFLQKRKCKSRKQGNTTTTNIIP